MKSHGRPETAGFIRSRRRLLQAIPWMLLGSAHWAQSTRLSAAAARDSVIIAYPNDVPNWDPNSAGNPMSLPIHRCVFETLLDLTPDLQLATGLAESYRWLDANKRVLEIDLRRDVTFHNGDPLTSDDVRFTFETRAVDKTLMISGVWGPTLVEGVEAASPNKALFHFRSSYVTAPKLLATIPAFVLPRRYFERVGREAFLAKPVGSGPYRLVDYQRDSRIVLEAYDRHWGGPPPIARVIFQVMKDPSARISAVQAGEVDFAHSLPIREAVRLGGIPGLVADMHPIAVDYLIHMVNKGMFREKNVRLAMHHAIDKEALSRAFFQGKAVPLSMWEGPGDPAYDPRFHFDYSPPKALALLQELGYSPAQPLTIPFSTFNGVYPGDFDLARAIVQMWSKVGIHAQLSVLDLTKYFELAQAGTLEAPVLYAWTNSTSDPEMWSGLILDPKKFFSIWRSDDIPARLDPLLHEVNEDKRLEGYQAFDQWAVNQGYALPLLKGVGVSVHARRITYQPYRNGWLAPYTWKISNNT